MIQFIKNYFLYKHINLIQAKIIQSLNNQIQSTEQYYLAIDNKKHVNTISFYHEEWKTAYNQTKILKEVLNYLNK